MRGVPVLREGAIPLTLDTARRLGLAVADDPAGQDPGRSRHVAGESLLWQGWKVIEDVNRLLEGFANAGSKARLFVEAPSIVHECLPAPHCQPGSLPAGYAAVYVFSLSSPYGRECTAGANRVLKVGKVGPNSSARFSSQHYQPNSARSNLAKSLITETVLWPYLGIESLGEADVKQWMLRNLERDHFFVPAAAEGLERQLERYLRGHLGPVFEG